ncbi:potassium-transporting ATPase subunit C, partial [Xenorhabdus bovienii]
MIWLRSSIVLLTFLTIITGIAYPLLVTGISEALF